MQETPLDNQEGFHSSAPCRTWTGDLRITNASLYQLSQGSILIWKMLWKTQSNFRWPVRESNPGLRRERASSWPLDQQAVCFIIESRRRDSNTRPLRPERSALPNWATPRYDFLAFEAVLISDSYILSRLPKKCKRFFEKNWKSFKKLKKPFKINIFTLLTYISKLLWIT